MFWWIKIPVKWHSQAYFSKLILSAVVLMRYGGGSGGVHGVVGAMWLWWWRRHRLLFGVWRSGGSSDRDNKDSGVKSDGSGGNILDDVWAVDRGREREVKATRGRRNFTATKRFLVILPRGENATCSPITKGNDIPMKHENMVLNGIHILKNVKNAYGKCRNRHGNLILVIGSLQTKHSLNNNQGD